MSKFIIYALYHPDSSYVYVGRSSSGLKRPKVHGQAGRVRQFAAYPVIKWIVKQRKMGREYEIAVLEELASVGELNEAEKFHIAYFKSLGIPLLNCSDGGEGANPTPETRAKIALAAKNISDETRAKRSASLKGRKYSAETLAKMSKGQLARNAHPVVAQEVRARISASLKGRPRPSEVVAKVAAALRGRKGHRHTPETIAKMRVAQQNRKRFSWIPRVRINLKPKHFPLSAEVRAKISAKLKGRKLASETKAKIAATLTSIVRSPEAYAKAWKTKRADPVLLARSLRGLRRDGPAPGCVEASVKARLGKPLSAEHRAKLSIINKVRLANKRRNSVPRFRINLLPGVA